MKKTTNKKKPVKLEPQWIKIQLKEQKEIQLLETIKHLTKEKTASKAVYEALENYPQISKRADGLNYELQKVNREYEQLSMKFATVQRAFKLINEVDKLNSEIEDTKIKSFRITYCSICEEPQDENMFCKNCD